MKKSLVALSIASTIILLGLGFLFRGLLVPDLPPAPVLSSSQSSDLSLTRENLLMLVNEERAKVGVAPLVIDEMLNQSAQWKAEDMKIHNYRAHVKPGETSPNGLEYLKVLNQQQMKCRYISENIAWMRDETDLSATAAIEGWKGSEKHYAAMVNPEYTLTGFGIANDVAVEHFCIPL